MLQNLASNLLQRFPEREEAHTNGAVDCRAPHLNRVPLSFLASECSGLAMCDARRPNTPTDEREVLHQCPEAAFVFVHLSALYLYEYHRAQLYMYTKGISSI